jgi:hypothetical protein
MEFDIQPLIIKLIVVLIIVLPYLYHLIFVFEQSKIINNAIKCSKLKYIIEKNTLRYSLYKFNTNINHEIFNILAFISILSLSILLYYMYDNRFLYAIIFNILLFLLIFLPNINKSKNTSELNDYIHLLYTINKLLKDNEIPEKLKKIIKRNIGIIHECTNVYDINVIYNNTTEYTQYISIDITNDDYSYVKNTIANFIDINNKDDFQEKIDFCSKTLHLDFKNNTNTNTIALQHSNKLLYGSHWGDWFYSYHFITGLFIGIIYILLDIYDDKVYIISLYIFLCTIIYIFLAFYMIKGNQLFMLSRIPLLIIILLI